MVLVIYDDFAPPGHMLALVAAELWSGGTGERSAPGSTGWLKR
jgi:hypothetical protein